MGARHDESVVVDNNEIIVSGIKFRYHIPK